MSSREVELAGVCDQVGVLLDRVVIITIQGRQFHNRGGVADRERLIISGLLIELPGLTAKFFIQSSLVTLQSGSELRLERFGRSGKVLLQSSFFFFEGFS